MIYIKIDLINNLIKYRTWDESENIPPFLWSKADFGNTTRHIGLPDKPAFLPIHVFWQL